MYRVGLRNMFFHPEQVIFAIHKKVGAISVEYFSNRKVTGQNVSGFMRKIPRSKKERYINVF